MKRIWTLIKNKIAAKLFPFVARNAAPLFDMHVQYLAKELSLKTTMAYLERSGFLHCVFCPQRFGLVNVGDYKACGRHEKQVREMAAKRPAERLKKKAA